MSRLFKIAVSTCLAILLSYPQVFAQEDSVRINKIIFIGNDKTKDAVLLREMAFKEGDKVSREELPSLLKWSENKLISTGLFNLVKSNIVNWDVENGTADTEINLEENWYIYPTYIFELADRNFNVWWQEQNRSFDRVNYGVKLSHYNLNGYRDRLKAKFQLGYTRKYELDYLFPYLNEARTIGIGMQIFYSDNKEIGYITESNKTLFQKADDERVLLKRFRVGTRLTYRPGNNLFSEFRLEFHRNAVNEFVIQELNPNYFLEARDKIRFFFLELDVQYDRRLYTLYPQGGFLLFGNIKKEGIGIFKEYNNLSVAGGWEYYKKISPRLIIGNRTKGKTNLTRQEVSFANNTGLGWDSDIVSGFELYVMDGTDYVVFLNNIKYQFFNKDTKTSKYLPRQFEKVNIKMSLRFNFDFAKVHEKTYVESNNINNRWFYGYGGALDIIFFNNFLFSFEYSFNDLGESGYFLHSSSSF